MKKKAKMNKQNSLAQKRGKHLSYTCNTMQNLNTIALTW